MQLCNMNDIDAIPDVPEGQDKWPLMEKLACRIVARVRRALRRERYTRAKMSDYPYCTCGQDADDDMVLCCNPSCVGRWFHFGCANPVLRNKPNGDWFWFWFSPDCLASGNYIYCKCQKRRGASDLHMTVCTRGDECQSFKKYHPECLNDRPNPTPGQPWYCSQHCRMDDNDNGALLLASAVARSVPPGQSRHDTGGGLSDRLAHEMTWECVANLCGQKGGNIGLDLVNEFLNNHFKEMMKRSRGRYTDKQAKRSSQIGREFGKVFHDTLVQSFALQNEGASSRSIRKHPDVVTLVGELHPESLFGYTSGRHHAAYPVFGHHRPDLRDEEKLRLRLCAPSTDYDFWKTRGLRLAALRREHRQ